MKRIMLLNPKGGSGKTTIATSLASYYARQGQATAIFDHDAQGSSTRWLRVRPKSLLPIYGVAAFENKAGSTRVWQMRVPPGVERVVVDTPAGVRAQTLLDMIRSADKIIVPVLPSHIDIDAVSSFLEDLTRVDSVRDGDTQVAVVANRVRTRTTIFHELESFLRHAKFPFVARLRDSQNYMRAQERGTGIHDLRSTENRTDRRQWKPLLDWLDGNSVPEMEPLDTPGRTAANASYSLPL